MSRKRDLLQANQAQANFIGSVLSFAGSVTEGEDEGYSGIERRSKFKQVVNALQIMVAEGLMEMPKALGAAAVIAEAGAAVAISHSLTNSESWLTGQHDIFLAASLGVSPAIPEDAT